MTTSIGGGKRFSTAENISFLFFSRSHTRRRRFRPRPLHANDGFWDGTRTKEGGKSPKLRGKKRKFSGNERSANLFPRETTTTTPTGEVKEAPTCVSQRPLMRRRRWRQWQRQRPQGRRQRRRRRRDLRLDLRAHFTRRAHRGRKSQPAHINNSNALAERDVKTPSPPFLPSRSPPPAK